MNLPTVIADLVSAQNSFDSAAYAQCFTDTAIVFDEGKNHTGTAAIQQWIDKANKEYQATMNPIEYFIIDETLKAEISGTFPGSPLVLTYQFQLSDGKIQSLKIV